MLKKMINFETDIINCLQVLKNGGIILYPTDTIWGIGCDATNSSAIQQIYKLKKRPEKKSMIMLVSGENMIRQYVSNASEEMLSYILSSQKPTTAIFENAIHLPPQLVNADGSIAIRIPKDEFCLRLIKKLQKPLVSTSANISGQKFPQNFKEVSDEIKNGVDYIVQHRQNDFSKSSPSSIIKLTNNQIEVIR